MFDQKIISEIQRIDSREIALGSCLLDVLREDQIHPSVSGNKFRKLKYSWLDAIEKGCQQVITFGGAYSNHIAAVAYAGYETGVKTVGVIRGEELHSQVLNNETLSFARNCGMRLYFITRDEYKEKEEPIFLEKLQKQFGDSYIIPEGGTNALAIKGCEEMLVKEHEEYDYICTAVGTGGTLAGLVSASLSTQHVLGFSALKGNFQISEVRKYTSKSNFIITDAYCFGGYAKIDIDLVRFVNDFKTHTGIPLDPVYTGKMMYGILQMISDGKIKENSRILAVHTGGLQGIPGMNNLLKKKNLPQIE